MIQNYGLINDRSPHLVADLCEIISYFEQREVSRGDLESILSQRSGEGLLRDLDLGASDSAETNEKFQALSEEVFRHLAYRIKAFGEWYPFSTDADVLVLAEGITKKQEIYAALLAFSRLKMFKAECIVQFAKDFEILCVEASFGFTGTWEVIHFGTGGRDRPAFGNKLKDALLVLSEHLREHPNEKEIMALPDNNTGDAGIDIVICKNWDDPARAIPTFFAQCAAQQTNWPAKRFEASALNLEKFFGFFHKPGTILFIPLCFRGTDGLWLDSSGHQTIVVDRKRLLELIEARISASGGSVEILENIPRPFDPGCAVNA